MALALRLARGEPKRLTLRSLPRSARLTNAADAHPPVLGDEWELDQILREQYVHEVEDVLIGRISELR